MLSVRGLRGDTVEELDLDVCHGEIVGLAGITGSGREDVIPLVAGQIPREDGDVWIDAESIANYDPAEAIGAGAAFVTAERAVLGTVGTMSVRENLTITDARHDSSPAAGSGAHVSSARPRTGSTASRSRRHRRRRRSAR